MHFFIVSAVREQLASSELSERLRCFQCRSRLMLVFVLEASEASEPSEPPHSFRFFTAKLNTNICWPNVVVIDASHYDHVRVIIASFYAFNMVRAALSRVLELDSSRSCDVEQNTVPKQRFMWLMLT